MVGQLGVAQCAQGGVDRGEDLGELFHLLHTQSTGLNTLSPTSFTASAPANNCW
jgi:hypothetical protein